MPLPKKTIRVTKIDAARSQLKTAITLWFDDGDPVSILALAHGAHEILHRIYRNRGFSDLLYDAKIIKEEYRPEFARALKAAPSFIKHFNQSQHEEEDTAIEFPYWECMLFIYFSVYAISKITNELSDEETAFWAWCSIQESQLFLQTDIDKFLPVGALQTFAHVRDQKPNEFYHLVKVALALNRERKRPGS
jgi:hypothetical protein